MYLNYYGMHKEPFHVTPDPSFLYFSPSHKEALAGIIYAVQKRKGFVAVTGEVGSGKTTVIRSFLESVRSEQYKIVYVFYPNLTLLDFLHTIFQELGIACESSDVSECVRVLQAYLIEVYRQGGTVVLVIDEAQSISVETLENLRLLSNLETNEDKLLQMVLVGQPELDEKLALNELRQLRQRIVIRARIEALTAEECVEYMRHRLALASRVSRDVFTLPALKLIAKRAKGNPRILNVLCDNALLAGYSRQEPVITPEVVHEVLADYDGRVSPASKRRTGGMSGLRSLFRQWTRRRSERRRSVGDPDTDLSDWGTGSVDYLAYSRRQEMALTAITGSLRALPVSPVERVEGMDSHGANI